MILAQQNKYSSLNRHLTNNSEGCSSVYSRESNLADEQNLSNYDDTVDERLSMEDLTKTRNEFEMINLGQFHEKQSNRNIFNLDKIIQNKHEIALISSSKWVILKILNL